MQKDMFSSRWVIPVGDKPKTMLWLFERFSKGMIKLPPHQRKFVWEDSKIIEWADSIRRGHSVGVIATYQLQSDIDNDIIVIYLNDGRQRLGAVEKISENLSDFDFTDETFHQCLDFFEMTVQHYVYQSHDEALVDFQNLNKGTHANPAEYYRGLVTLTPYGEYAYENIKKAVSVSSYHILRKPISIDDRDNVDARVALALFYALVSNHKSQKFWGVTSKKVTNEPEKTLEYNLGQYLRSNPKHKFDAELTKFTSFLSDTTALIDERIRSVLGGAYPMSTSLYHVFLFTNVYRRNNNIPIALYVELLDLFIEKSQGLKSQIIAPEGGGYMAHNIQRSSLYKIAMISRAYGLTFFDYKPTRKSISTRKGYDNSHKLPFSEFGEGETFPEPAPLNRARGAKPVDEDN